LAPRVWAKRVLALFYPARAELSRHVAAEPHANTVRSQNAGITRDIAMFLGVCRSGLLNLRRQFGPADGGCGHDGGDKSARN
jgi:hypothetical protein